MSRVVRSRGDGSGGTQVCASRRRAGRGLGLGLLLSLTGSLASHASEGVAMPGATPDASALVQVKGPAPISLQPSPAQQVSARPASEVPAVARQNASGRPQDAEASTAGLEHVSPSTQKGPPVVLVSGLFLAPSIFQHGPAGGLAAVLERHGFDVWTWNPWASGAQSLASLTEAAVAVTNRIANNRGKEPQWIGMEVGALVGLRAVGRGAPIASVVALAPRLELPPCFPPLLHALKLVVEGHNSALPPVVSSLWSWGDVPTHALDVTLTTDMAPVPPAIARELMVMCLAPTKSVLEVPNWDKLWLPTLFVASGRDGQAPIELVYEQYDQAPAEFKRLLVLEDFPSPSHLGLLYGRQALKEVYRPVVRWLKRPTPDARPRLPLVQGKLSERGAR